MRANLSFPVLMTSLLLFFSLTDKIMASKANIHQAFYSIPYDLQGKVVDEQAMPIEVGNILALSPVDSSLIQGDLFQDGQFQLKGIHASPVLLQITALGYESHYELVIQHTDENKIDIGTITLKYLLMQGVEVVAKRPLVEHRGTDVVVNVANTVLSNMGTAMDVLRNSPKVLINSGGQVTVLGKGAALIYVDGQLIPSTQLLQNLASNDIKSVEIIENPSARYDAAGNAVINIITKSKSLEGYKIGLSQEFEQGRFFRSYYKADAYYRLPKLLLQASYGFRPYKRRGREFYFRSIDADPSLVEIDNKLVYSRKNISHDVSFRTSYQLGAQQKIGFQYYGVTTDGEQNSFNKNIFNTDKAVDFRLNTNIVAPFAQGSNTLSAFYEYKLDTLGSQLSLSGQYADYDLERNESIRQSLYKTSVPQIQDRQSRNVNDIAVKSIQLDYRYYFNENNQLSLGAKYAQVSNNSQLDFANKVADGGLVSDPSFSNQYAYQEDISAAYGEWIVQKSSLKTTLGLRAERTQSVGIAGGEVGQKLFERDYLDLFPSAAITKTLDENNNLNLSYNYRIQRPQFQFLNPFVWYVDSLVSLQGNANLKPQYSHLIDAAWNHKAWNLKFNYTHTKDQINTNIRVKDPENPAVFAFVWDNIESVKNYSLALSRSIQIGSYSSYNVIGARTEAHQYRDLGALVTNQKSGFYIYSNQSIKLPGDVTLEAIYSYSSPRVDGIYTDNPISYLNVAVSRKFWNNQLQVRLLANDIFDTYKFTGISTVNNNDWTYLSEGDWHFLKLSLNWDFGKLGTSSLQENKISKSELGRISKM